MDRHEVTIDSLHESPFSIFCMGFEVLSIVTDNFEQNLVAHCIFIMGLPAIIFTAYLLQNLQEIIFHISITLIVRSCLTRHCLSLFII